MEKSHTPRRKTGSFTNKDRAVSFVASAQAGIGDVVGGTAFLQRGEQCERACSATMTRSKNIDKEGAVTYGAKEDPGGRRRPNDS